MRRLLPVLLAAALFAGCSHVTVNGMSVRADWWAEIERDIRLRGQIDMSCPSVQVVLQKMQGKFPVVVTAQGCGLAALYQRALNRSGGHYTSRDTVWTLVSGPSRLAAPLGAR